MPKKVQPGQKVKNKSHKGTLKRIRVTKTGMVKHKPASSSHLKSYKAAKRLRRLRKTHALSNSDAKRFEKLLHRRLRGRDQARAELRRSPSPAERRAALAEKWAKEDAAWAAEREAAKAGGVTAQPGKPGKGGKSATSTKRAGGSKASAAGATASAPKKKTTTKKKTSTKTSG